MLTVVQALDRAPIAEIESNRAITGAHNAADELRSFAGPRESGHGTGGIPYTMRDMTQEKMILMPRS